MTDELVLYTNPMSRGRTVRWMLEELDQPYRAEIMDFTALKASTYLAINPMGKVPALTHGAVVVTELAAICAYLADAFPDAGLAPAPGDPARGPYYRWLFYASGPVEAAVTNKALNFELPPGRERMAGYGCFGDVMDVLEQAVSGGDYVAGGRFSAADLVLGHQIGFGLRFKSIEPRPAFKAYWDRLSHRPAYVRASQMDDALIGEVGGG